MERLSEVLGDRETSSRLSQLHALKGDLAPARGDPDLADFCEECEENHACRVCHGARRVRVAFGVTELCKCVTNADVRGQLEERAGVPALFRDATLDSWVPRDQAERRALALVRMYCASWPPAKPTLLLAGGKGTGKTHLACAVLRQVRERWGVYGRFEESVPLLARMRATFNEHATETEQDIVAALTAVPLLVLDDLAAEKATGWSTQQLYLVVNARYSRGLPLVVTTNAARDMDLDERIVDRLLDGQRGTVVVLEGASHRSGQIMNGGKR